MSEKAEASVTEGREDGPPVPPTSVAVAGGVQAAPTYRIAQAADLLGVSADTVRRWLAAGRLSELRDDAGRAVVSGAELAELAQELAAAPESVHGASSSARNRFVGLVTGIKKDTVMAQVDIQAGPHRVVSLISREAVDELGLEIGSLAVATVKATNVIVERPES